MPSIVADRSCVAVDRPCVVTSIALDEFNVISEVV